MGPGEAISLLGVCALGIVFLGVTFAAYTRRLAFRQRQMELDAQVRIAGLQGAAGAGSERLEQRVRVLERIATERGQDVAHQIEALRDRPLIEGEAR